MDFEVLGTKSLDSNIVPHRNSHADPHLLPINKVVNKYQYLACTYEQHSNIGDLIRRTVKDFTSGPIGQAISNLAGNVIDMMIGEQSSVALEETR